MNNYDALINFDESTFSRSTLTARSWSKKGKKLSYQTFAFRIPYHSSLELLPLEMSFLQALMDQIQVLFYWIPKKLRWLFEKKGQNWTMQLSTYNG